MLGREESNRSVCLPPAENDSMAMPTNLECDGVSGRPLEEIEKSANSDAENGSQPGSTLVGHDRKADLEPSEISSLIHTEEDKKPDQLEASWTSSTKPNQENGAIVNNGGSRSVPRKCAEALRNSFSSGFRWFWKDLTKSHLIWIKLIFFFQSASLVVLYPYLVIHMRSLGLSVEEVAVVNSVVPVADIIGPTLAGLIADKIGNFRIFMSGLTAVGGVASILLLVIPNKLEKSSIGGAGLSDLCCWDPLGGGAPRSCFPTNLTNASMIESNWIEGSQLVCGNETLHYANFTVLKNNSFLDYDIFSSDTCDEQLCYLRFGNGVTRSNWQVMLWIYIALRAILDLLRASSIMMFEGAVVVTIKQLGGDYGLQKLFGTFGAIIWGPISGVILDAASAEEGFEDYSPVFYLYFVMRVIIALLILKLDLAFKPPAKKVFKNIWKLILKPHIFIFLVMFFICGSIWGFIESYLFWFLEDIGSNKFTMGLSLGIGTLAGIPLTIASGAIIKKFGNVNVIIVALAIYALRLLGYSYINTAMESLIFEVLKPFGNSLLLIAAMTYAKDQADITNMASLEGIMGALYFGVGKALGGLVGGLLIDGIGNRSTFRIFSLISVVAAVIYLIYSLIDRRRKRLLEGVSGHIVEAQPPETSSIDCAHDRNDQSPASPASNSQAGSEVVSHSSHLETPSHSSGSNSSTHSDSESESGRQSPLPSAAMTESHARSEMDAVLRLSESRPGSPSGSNKCSPSQGQEAAASNDLEDDVTLASILSQKEDSSEPPEQVTLNS